MNFLSQTKCDCVGDNHVVQLIIFKITYRRVKFSVIVSIKVVLFWKFYVGSLPYYLVFTQ